MVVKIEFLEDNRVYSIGIKRFLRLLLDYDVDDNKITTVVKELLSKDELRAEQQHDTRD